MRKSAMIRARVEPEIKKQAESIFQQIGLNASEAISLFYYQVKLKNGMPFDVNISSEGRKSKIAVYAQTALIEQSKAMKPEARLSAFLNHSYLMKQMGEAGRQARPKNESG